MLYPPNNHLIVSYTNEGKESSTSISADQENLNIETVASVIVNQCRAVTLGGPKIVAFPHKSKEEKGITSDLSKGVGIYLCIKL